MRRFGADSRYQGRPSATWPCLNFRSGTTLPVKLVKIGAKVLTHSRYVIFQMAEVAVPKRLFAGILERIRRLRPREPVPG